MARIPETIRIGPLGYSVEVSQEKIDIVRRRVGDVEALAEICHSQMTIILDPEMAEERRKVSLVHEVVHGMLNQCATGDVHNDEEFVRRFSFMLMDTLRRNPQLVEYLVM